MPADNYLYVVAWDDAGPNGYSPRLSMWIGDFSQSPQRVGLNAWLLAIDAHPDRLAGTQRGPKCRRRQVSHRDRHLVDTTSGRVQSARLLLASNTRSQPRRETSLD
jgi:hypothetical protein